MNGIVAETDRLGGELLRLANDDAVAFEQVMMAFRMPKATPEEQVARKQAIEKGYRAAVMPPLLVCEKSLRVLELALCVAKRGTPNAASDAGVAALLAFAAIEAGALNVEINLAAIQDEQFRQTCAHQVQAARVQGRAVHDESVGIVEETLN
jgi:formiminotetrahydrofolate cyclodeaminase